MSEPPSASTSSLLPTTQPLDLLSRLSSPPPLLKGKRLDTPATASSKSPLISTLPARPAFALPSRPDFAASASAAAAAAASSSRRRDSRSRSPDRGERRQRDRDEGDFYVAPASPRRNDVYIPPASPTRSDRYEPVYDYRRRTRSPSPFQQRYRSYHPDSERSRSFSRSLSPRKRPRLAHSRPRSPSIERSPPPANFTTLAGRRADREEQSSRRASDRADRKWEKYHAKQAEREQKAEAAQKEREEKEKVFAEERARKQKILELRQKAIEEAKQAQAAAYNSVPAKRSADSEDPVRQTARAVPTGPRGFGLRPPSGPSGAPTAPSGPRASKPVPTGPSGIRSQPAAVSPPARKTGQRTATPPTRSRAGSTGSDDMPGPSRGRGRGRTPISANGSSSKAPVVLEPPEHNHQYILDTYGRNVTLKAQWAENPKAPLANYLGDGRGGASDAGLYEAQEGLIGKKRMIRVSVLADGDRQIVGIGDHTSKKEAEKLAALSAVLQLSELGLLEKGRPSKSSSSTTKGSASTSQPAAGETATLSDESQITYDRARQFMEYYCKRYKFGKPDIDFSQSTTRTKKGKSVNMISLWEAVMTVGGRKIGMGSAGNKKDAQIKCYLDVTQYLESCDPDLWRDFTEYSKKDKSADIGLAPHLIFQMSDEVNESIQGLIGDIRQSQLLKNAPTSGVTSSDQPLPSWSARNITTSESELDRKSAALQDKLADYHSDPRLTHMRAQRQSLPVTSRATDILAKIEVNDVTIVMAATGSGKTTQIPQLLFDDWIKRGDGAKCNIICTQPRRLAAMSVAERIADERGDRLGVEIGYQVRFDNKLPQPNGCITFCTTGIFLKRMQSSLGVMADKAAVAAMDQITHIVVDEVHERDIDTDLSLVVLKRLLADRKARGVPLKIVLMSATIDPTLFQRYFADARGRLAPVAEVPGRTFPVERHYLDEVIPELSRGLPSQMGGWVFQEKDVVKYLDSELSRDKSLFAPGTGVELAIPYSLVALMVAYVLQRSDDGHVLVFLPGWEEIKKVADILLDGRSNLLGLRFSDGKKFSIHYLHSSIPAAEQKEVFRDPPEGVRRIILATNIAETSVTIPNVVYVVDTGRVKEKRYDPERHMSSLVTAWVGASNLNQRAGRAGRHREGEYFGLVSKNRLESLDPHQLVEMKRSDLSNVVMHVKALNLGEVGAVLAATIEPPEPSRITSAMEVLRMLGALDADQNLTSLGRVLLQLPIDAAMGKMCLYGSFFRCLDSALTLAAVLTNRDPFVSPVDKKVQADEIKDSWSPRAFRSDPLAIVAAYTAWAAMDDRGEYGRGNAFCSDNFLSKPTLLQIKQVKVSLLQSLEQAGVIAVSAGGSVNRLGRRGQIPPELNENSHSLPMLAALIAMAAAPNFALRTSERTCRTAQDKVVMIHNSSVNSRRREIDGPEQASASFNPAEKRLYAFQEKGRNVAPGQNPANAPTQLRTVTRLDPMTYMLFGAYELVVTQRGMECDRWLPVTGNLYALDDVQRLKDLLEACMLRVFEGVGKSLMKGRDQRWARQEEAVDVKIGGGSSRIGDTDTPDAADEGENESDDEGDGDADETRGLTNGSGSNKHNKRIVEPLSMDEIKELEMLTSDVVRILDAYALEREGAGSTRGSRTPSRAPSRASTPGPGSFTASGPGPGSGAEAGQGLYRPPVRGRKW